MKYAILFSSLDKPLAIVGYENNFLQLFDEFDAKVLASGFSTIEEAKEFENEFLS